MIPRTTRRTTAQTAQQRAADRAAAHAAEARQAQREEYLAKRAQYEADPAGEMRRLKARLAIRRRNLLDPHWEDQERRFPKWVPGMTTAEYIGLFTGYASSGTLKTVDYVHRVNVPAPWNELDGVEVQVDLSA